MRLYAVLALWAAIVGSVQCSGSCYSYVSKETLGVNVPGDGLHQIHVRHNLKGSVGVTTQQDDTKGLQVQIEKIGASAGTVKYVVVNQTLFPREQGNILVLQVDKTPPPAGLAKVMIGVIAAVAMVVTVSAILTWWWRRHQCAKKHRFHLVSNDEKRSTSPVGTNQPEPAVAGTPEEPEPEEEDDGGFRDHIPRDRRRLPEPPPPPSRQPAVQVPQTNHKPQSPVVRRGGSATMTRGAFLAVSIVALLSVVCASCLADVKVHLLILVPPSVKLHTVKAFFNQAHNNKLKADELLWNNTKILAFDVPGSPTTANAPCQPHEADCPVAMAHSQMDCDPRSKKCICRQGFMKSENKCVDVNECEQYKGDVCPPTATCQNTVGSYTCQCGYGFYRDGSQCKESPKTCSMGCPDGQFEAQACSNTADRVCQDCSKCSGPMYELKPCTPGSDRKCIHAAHPLTITSEPTTPTYLEGLRIEHSNHVFLENLHSSRFLETTYYITANGQASDFTWVRESGLTIKVGLYDAYILPEYEDFNHTSDNQYMLEKPNTNEDKEKISEIISKYCRNPIPDYYSVALEISRDRTTSAYEITCDSTDQTKPRCPPEYRDGDSYVHRTMNQPCQQMGTFPEQMIAVENDIVCTQKTSLLQEIFNQTYKKEQPIKFPTGDCGAAKKRCDQCLKFLTCRKRELVEQEHCCQIECYTQENCKKATSDACTITPVVCAMGDTYRYTIQPVFQNIRKEFQCHLKYKKPKILYKMFYYILIPGTNFETPKQTVTIDGGNLDYQSKGSVQVDYISIIHDTGLKLKDELLLLGKDGGRNGGKFAVHTLKKEDEFGDKKVTIHKISHNTYVASMQFSKPFAYSTSSWADQHRCEKDVSVMKHVQPLYKDDPQSVQVNLKTEDQPYLYTLRADETPPHFKLSVPGNVSILSWYYKDDGPTLKTGDALMSNLSLTWDHKIWKIYLAGELSGCPGYFSVVINDRTTMEELFNYDVLVFCPRKFNLTFYIPNWGQKMDRTFDVLLTDPRKSYSVYLTNMWFETDPMELGRTVTKGSSISFEDKAEWAPVNIVLIIAKSIVVVLCLLSVFLLCTHKKQASYTVNPAREAQSKSRFCCAPNMHLNSGQCIIVVVYAVTRLLYSLIFTFTVISALITHVIQDDYKTLEGINHFQSYHLNKSRELAMGIQQFGQQELLRQTKLMLSMQGSCSLYMDDLFRSVQNQVENLTTNYQWFQNEQVTPSISHLMIQRYKQKLSHYRTMIDRFKKGYTKHFDSTVKPPLSKYQQYLETIYENDWLDMPAYLFNRSDFSPNRPSVFRNNPYLSGRAVDFVAFLEVEEVGRAQLIPHQMWQRFHESLPDLPELPVQDIEDAVSKCRQGAEKNKRKRPLPKHLNSLRYFAPKLPGKTEIGPKFEHHNMTRDFGFIIKDEPRNYKGLLFSVQAFVAGLNLQMFKYVFMALDVLLLICRCSRTYINIHKLCHGFEEMEVLDEEKYQNASHGAPQVDNEADMMQVGNRPDVANTGSSIPGPDDNLLDLTGATSSESRRRMLSDGYGFRPYSNEKSIYPRAGFTIGETSAQRKNLSTYLLSALQHMIVPKLVIACLLFVIYYITVLNVYHLISMDVLSHYNGYQTFISDLDLYINQTNTYLNEQAAHLNNVAMAIFKKQMNTELFGMQSAVVYFNTEQRILSANYLREACALQGELLNRQPCNITSTPSLLDLPVLPCNFVRIQPQFYAGVKTDGFVSEVKNGLVPLVAALRNFFIKSSFTILVIATMMFLLHAAGAVLFLFLKTRLVFSVHKVYITSIPPSVVELQHQGNAHHASVDISNLGNPIETVSVETNPNQPSEGLLNEFTSYSETKV